MTVRIELLEAKHGFNCVCCRERVRSCEKYIAVVNNDTDRPVRGERYCQHCEEYAIANNEDELADPEVPADGGYDDGESHLRRMEQYGAYRAAGCTDAFWTDRDAGYID